MAARDRDRAATLALPSRGGAQPEGDRARQLKRLAWSARRTHDHTDTAAQGLAGRATAPPVRGRGSLPRSAARLRRGDPRLRDARRRAHDRARVAFAARLLPAADAS